MSRDAGAILAASPLMRGLTAAQITELLDVSTDRDFASGDIIVAAGKPSDGVHLLMTGEAEVLASGDAGPDSTRVAVLAPGQVFGELSALTGEPAIGTVRASATPTRVKTLPRAGLDALGDRTDITSTILRNVITVNQRRLSDSNTNYVRQLEQTTALLLERQTYARFLFTIILLLGICLLVNHWLAGKPGVDVYSPAFAWAYLITLVLPTLWIAWRGHYPLALFGITTRNLGRDLLWSSVILVGVLGIGALALLLAGFPLSARFHPDYLLRYGPLYSLQSALQELMGRGVMLGMMLKIFGDSNWKQRQISNVAVSMMFGLIHIHFGFVTVGLMMAFSLLLGTYYFVHRNLAGPVLIHAALGITAFMIGII